MFLIRYMNGFTVKTSYEYNEWWAFMDFYSSPLSLSAYLISRLSAITVFWEDIINEDNEGKRSVNIDLLESRYTTLKKFWLWESEKPWCNTFENNVLTGLEVLLEKISLCGICNDIEAAISPKNGHPESFSNNTAVYCAQWIVRETERIIFSRPRDFKLVSRIKEMVKGKTIFWSMKLSPWAVQAIHREIKWNKDIIYSRLDRGGSLHGFDIDLTVDLSHDYNIYDLDIPRLVDYAIERLINAFQHIDNPIYFYYIFYAIGITDNPALEWVSLLNNPSPHVVDPFREIPF